MNILCTFHVFMYGYVTICHKTQPSSLHRNSYLKLYIKTCKLWIFVRYSSLKIHNCQEGTIKGEVLWNHVIAWKPDTCFKLPHKIETNKPTNQLYVISFVEPLKTCDITIITIFESLNSFLTIAKSFGDQQVLPAKQLQSHLVFVVKKRLCISH